MLCKCGSKSCLGWGNRPAATYMGKQGLGAQGYSGSDQTVRNAAAPAPIPTRKHRKGTSWAIPQHRQKRVKRQQRAKTGLFRQQLTLGQCNSVASKGESMGLQKH